MDLAHLRYFKAIAASGSMTAAARVLGVTQPSLTVAMRHMEAALGTSLLDRDRSGVTLTAAGRVLLAHATDILSRVQDAEQEVRALEGDDVGRFVVGCHEPLGAYFLPGFLPDFLARHPRVELSLWNGPSPAVRRAVLAREVHFGLVVSPEPHPELVLVELFRDRFEVLGAAPSKDREAAERRLRAGPLLYAERIRQGHRLMAALESQGLAPERRLACGDLELVKSLALAGIGPALLPRRVACYGHEGRLEPLHPSFPVVDDTVLLAWRADFHRTAAANLLKASIVAHGRALAAVGLGS